MANHIKKSWEEYLTQFEHETFVDESLKRQFQLLQTLGVAALSEEDLTNVKTLEFWKLYSTHINIRIK